MFSGIVEEAAIVVNRVTDHGNLHLTLRCSFIEELKIDQSISHNGVCLTVVSLTEDTYTVTAIKETLDKTNLGLLNIGDKVNLERSMKINGRFPRLTKTDSLAKLSEIQNFLKSILPGIK